VAVLGSLRPALSVVTIPTAKTVTGSVEICSQVSILLDRTGLTLDGWRIICSKGPSKYSKQRGAKKRDSCKTSEMRVNFNFDVDLFFFSPDCIVLSKKQNSGMDRNLPWQLNNAEDYCRMKQKHYGYLLRRLATGKRLVIITNYLMRSY
jgi:hypothetical protein